MDTEYEGILGIIVTGSHHGYRSPVVAFIVGHKDLILFPEEVGFELNYNGEPKIPLLKPVDKSIEELLDGYQPRQYGAEIDELLDKMDSLNWRGYAYVMKNWSGTNNSKAPIMIVSATRYIDMNIWKEISTETFIQEINDRTNVVGEQ